MKSVTAVIVLLGSSASGFQKIESDVDLTTPFKAACAETSNDETICTKELCDQLNSVTNISAIDTIFGDTSCDVRITETKLGDFSFSCNDAKSGKFAIPMLAIDVEGLMNAGVYFSIFSTDEEATLPTTGDTLKAAASKRYTHDNSCDLTHTGDTDAPVFAVTGKDKDFVVDLYSTLSGTHRNCPHWWVIEDTKIAENTGIGASLYTKATYIYTTRSSSTTTTTADPNECGTSGSSSFLSKASLVALILSAMFIIAHA